MFKYVRFTKVKTDLTTLEFRGEAEGVEVFNFDVDVVSIKSDDVTKIDTLIAMQDEAIGCTEITQDEFRTLVADSAQLNAIRNQVKREIAKKYDLADEIAMSKKATDDSKRVAYEAYVVACIAEGDAVKAGIGY